MVRVEDAHAIRPAQGDAGLTADAGDARLEPDAVLALLGKAAVINHRGADAVLGGGDERVEHPLVAHAEQRHVGALRQFGYGRPTAPAEHRRVIGIDRIDRAAKADALERHHQPAADRRLVGGADDRD